MLRKNCLLWSLTACTLCYYGTASSAATLYNDPEAVFTPESGVSPTLEGPVNAALAGDKLALDQVYTYNKLLPSSDRISRAVIADLIHRAHIKAKTSAKQGKALEAANILRQSLNLSHYMSCLACRRAPWSTAIPYCWLASWKDSSVGLQLADYIAPLNDYGFFLQKAGKDSEAIAIFRAVISEDPTREVAYLNLADSLKQSGKIQESGQYYRIYKQLMEHENKTVLIPKRVDVGRKQAITTDVDVDFEAVTYMDLVQDTIAKSWHPSKSDSSAKVVAQFHIDEDGHLKDVKITRTSGNEALDRSASEALAKVVLPPPPRSIKPDDYVQFSFDYNVSKANQSRLYPARLYPVDRWMRDVNESPTPSRVLPLVEALVLLHRFDDAQSEVEAAKKREPDNTELASAQSRIAKAREEANNEESAARNSMQQILRESAIKLAGGTLPAEWQAKEGVSNVAAYPQHRKDHAAGMIAIMNGAWDEAIVYLSRAALSFPSCKDSKTFLANAYNLRSIFGGGGTDKAMHDLHRAYCIDPISVVFQKNIAARMKTLVLDPTAASSRVAYGDTLNKSGDLVGAAAEYRIALTMKQDSSTLEKLAVIAATLKAGGKFDN